MTKEEIKATILTLKRPEELEKIIFDMVDNAQEVNSGLLNAIADILDNQADFDGAMADAYEDTQKVDEMTIKELEVLDAGQNAGLGHDFDK